MTDGSLVTRARWITYLRRQRHANLSPVIGRDLIIFLWPRPRQYRSPRYRQRSIKVLISELSGIGVAKRELIDECIDVVVHTTDQLAGCFFITWVSIRLIRQKFRTFVHQWWNGQDVSLVVIQLRMHVPNSNLIHGTDRIYTVGTRLAQQAWSPCTEHGFEEHTGVKQIIWSCKK